MPQEIQPITYFSAEYGVEEKLPLYAGGLGILAGDYVKQAGDEKIPLLAFGLFYRGGFDSANRTTETETQALMIHGFQLVHDADNKPLLVTVDTEASVIYVQAWTRTYGTARLYLFDTNVPQNSPEHQAITRYLYDADVGKAMFQELILGVASIKLLRTLNINPGIYHLNEGHMSFVALALAAEYLHDHPEETSFQAAIAAVKPHIVSTKHTILSGAGLYIDKAALHHLVHPYIQRHRIDFEEFFKLGMVEEPNMFSTTKFLLQASIRSNGVSMLHTIFEKQRHPKSTLMPITNGIYPPNWLSSQWPHEGIAGMTDTELWQTRNALRAELLEYIKKVSGIELNPKALTIVWARRFASYKRPHVLFSDLKKLEALVSDRTQPVQIIISGMAHEADSAGREVVEKIKKYVSEKPFKGNIVYLPTYNIDVARHLVRGADVWLNTPERGVEACGTSGMKAGINGGLQCSVSDGWIEEVDWSGIGWTLANEMIEKNLYDVLEYEVKKCFYDRTSEGLPEQWIKRVRKTIDIVKDRFTAHRMLKNYIQELYYPETEK